MDVVQFINKDQKEFLRYVEELGGSVRAAIGMTEISSRLLGEWTGDPDFQMALDNAVDRGRGTLEAAAMMGLTRNLASGKFEAVKATLQALDPETWNPATRLEVDVPAHRFIGFNGEDVLTGEQVDDAEYEELEDVSTEEAQARHTPSSEGQEIQGPSEE